VLYFAYGSNMSAELFDRRIGGVSLGSARLADHRLVFDLPSQRWTGHAANIRPASGTETWGRLWEIEADRLAVLDEYERAYHRIEVVVDHDGRSVPAFTYTVREERRSETPGSPVPSYREHMLAGGRACGLPPRYIESIERA